MPYMAYIAHVVTGVYSAVRWAYAIPVCVLFVSNRSGIVFNQSAGAITDHSPTAKDIDSYFKSLLYAEDPGHLKPVLSESERRREIFISDSGGIRTHNLLINSPACYL